MMKLSSVSNAMWRRHGNPWSIWTRLLSAPLMFVPFWNRSWKQGLAVAAWFAVNPFLFPEPRDKNGWGARAIRGERRWAKQRPRDAALAVQSVGSTAALGGLYAAYRRWPALTVASGAVVMLSNAWFLNRMAKTYGVEPDGEEQS